MKAKHQIIRASAFRMEFHDIEEGRRDVSALLELIRVNGYDTDFPVVACREFIHGRATGRYKVIHGRRRVIASFLLDPYYNVPCVLIDTFNEDFRIDVLLLGAAHTYTQILGVVNREHLAPNR